MTLPTSGYTPINVGYNFNMLLDGGSLGFEINVNVDSGVGTGPEVEAVANLVEAALTNLADAMVESEDFSVNQIGITKNITGDISSTVYPTP